MLIFFEKRLTAGRGQEKSQKEEIKAKPFMKRLAFVVYRPL